MSGVMVERINKERMETQMRIRLCYQRDFSDD